VISFHIVRFYVPLFSNDCIQRIQVASGAQSENQILDHLSYGVPFVAIVVDVGSNIRAHALSWDTKRKADQVYAFDPVLSTFPI
jgi:hypothetical protein